MTKQNDREDYALAGDVSVEEAREALGRFVRSHFRSHDYGGKERARISIPANPQRDDDIRLGAFITRAEKAFAALDEAREEAAQWKRLAEQTTDARLAEAIASREAMRRERDEAREETRREVQRVLDSPCESCRDNVDAVMEARAQLAALHAAATAVQTKARALPVSMTEIVHAEEWDDLDRAIADTQAAAAEHERRVRADERAKALRDAEAILRRCADRAFSAGATAVGLDGEIVRMHAGIYEAMVGEANALAKMADEAERGTR